MSSDDDCLICFDKIDSNYVYPNNDSLSKKCHIECPMEWYMKYDRGLITQDKVDKCKVIDVSNLNDDNSEQTKYICGWYASIFIVLLSFLILSIILLLLKLFKIF